MPLVRIMEHGQVTIPKKVRDALGLKKGDVAEVDMAEGKIVITPKRLVKQEALKQLREVMARVHAQNLDATEEEVVELALQAIEELRQEEYGRNTGR